MDVVGSEHVVGHIALVYVDVSPLSALRLVAGHGVGELHLEGVVVHVFAHMLHAVGLEGYVLIVVKHGVEQLFALLARQCGGFRCKRIEHYGSLKLVVAVVGELEPHVGKVEAVQLPYVAHAPDARPVAVGDEQPHPSSPLGRYLATVTYRLFPLRWGGREGLFFLLQPIIVVLYHHEHVAGGKLLFASEHHVAYSGVVYVGALVAPRNDDSLVHAHFRVAAVKLLDKLVARHHAYVGKAFEAD